MQVFLFITLLQCTTASLYGLSPSANIVSVDPTTGTMKQIGTMHKEAQSQGLSCSNTKDGILYYIGYNETSYKPNLVGLSVTNGSTLYEETLPFLESGFVGVGQQLGCDISEVVVVGHNNKSGTHQFLAFDPTTKTFRSIVEIQGTNLGILGATSTMDTKRGIIYTLFAHQLPSGAAAFDLYAVQTRAGKNAGQFEIVPTNRANGQFLNVMKYDSTLDKIIGFGQDLTTKQRNIITLDAVNIGKKRTWNTIGDVVGFNMEDGPIIAIDGNKNHMYAIIQPVPLGPSTFVNSTDCSPKCIAATFCCKDPSVKDGASACFSKQCSEIPISGGLNKTLPFSLVAMDLNNQAKVVSSPPLCTIAANDCPWSLDEFDTDEFDTDKFDTDKFDTANVARLEMIADTNNAHGVLWQAGLNERFAHLPPGAARELCGSFSMHEKIKDLLAKNEAERVKPHTSNGTLPTDFDLVQKFPQCTSIINDIRDQSNCGCCFAFAPAGAASDRLCIASNASVALPLSAQEACFCPYIFQGGCDGGYTSDPWQHLIHEGLVTGGQFNNSGTFGKDGLCSAYSLPHCHHHGPKRKGENYPSENTKGCPAADSPKCPNKCDSDAKAPYNSWKKSRYKISGKLLVYPNDDGGKTAMASILEYGSVSATMDVYSDFENYVSGIYHHVKGENLGGHAIRVVGWGVEDNVKYWKIANSWNPFWGEKGYFRIVRGTDECGIEDNMLSSSNTGKWSGHGL